ncbi:MAG: hypothetical protein ACOCP8_03675 [archaeon]
MILKADKAQFYDNKKGWFIFHKYGNSNMFCSNSDLSNQLNIPLYKIENIIDKCCVDYVYDRDLGYENEKYAIFKKKEDVENVILLLKLMEG